MLQKLSLTQVHTIAQLAQTARDARENLLHGVAHEIVSEPHPAKGEEDRAGSSGFEVLPADNPSVVALSHFIGELDAEARRELFALMRIGQGELAPNDWELGLSEATALGESNIAGILSEDIDLKSHLDKALYEMRLA